jgi:hypothetical protein
LWPLRGGAIVLRRPRLLLGTVLAMILVLLLVALSGAWVVHATWPAPGLPLLAWAWRAGRALVLGGTAVVGLWVTVVPVVMAVVLERIARQVHALLGSPLLPEPSAWANLRASLLVLRATLGMRVAAVVVCLLSSLLGPAGVLVCAVVIGYVACFDALDTALAARNCPGAQRLALLERHRASIGGGACCAGFLTVALGVTVIGWWLWLPALVAGAARQVHDWPLDEPARSPDTLDPA